tara:strand:- start:13 stop:180 length:168 start_codon:yes stop_codon:yes gene_type:complete
VTADQHQPLLRSLLNHGADLCGGGGIEESGGLIEHLHRLVAQPGAKQAEPVNLAA